MRTFLMHDESKKNVKKCFELESKLVYDNCTTAKSILRI